MLKQLSNTFNKLALAGQKLMLWVSIILGAILFSGGIFVSISYVPTKNLAVFVSTIFTSVAMFLIIKSFDKLKSIDIENSDGQTKTKLNARLSEKETELLNAKRQIEQLKSMQIRIESVEPILSMGLAKINTKQQHLMRKELKNTSEYKSWIFFKEQVEHHVEYLGLMERHIEARLGIDLNKIKLRQENNTIYVSGLKTEFQGYKNAQTDWHIKEIRYRKKVDGNEKQYTIIEDDKRIQDLIIAQERELEERLNSGIDFKQFDEFILKMAKEMITLLLMPMQQKIEFVEFDEGLDLRSFIAEHNRNLDHQIKKLQP